MPRHDPPTSKAVGDGNAFSESTLTLNATSARSCGGSSRATSPNARTYSANVTSLHPNGREGGSLEVSGRLPPCTRTAGNTDDGALRVAGSYPFARDRCTSWLSFAICTRITAPRDIFLSMLRNYPLDETGKSRVDIVACADFIFSNAPLYQYRTTDSLIMLEHLKYERASSEERRKLRTSDFDDRECSVDEPASAILTLR